MVALFGDELPTSLRSTTVKRVTASARIHALEKAVHSLPFQVGGVAQMLFHKNRIIRSLTGERKEKPLEVPQVGCYNGDTSEDSPPVQNVWKLWKTLILTGP